MYPFLKINTSLFRWAILLVSIATIYVFPSPVIAAEKINYRLKWLFNVSVAGDIFADATGLFAQAGLTVTVKEGGPERDAIREIELGHAQFGVASSDQVIRALAKKSPVVVIAQLFQVNPLHWIYREQTVKLEKASDLKGLKIGITYGGNDETIMRTLLAQAKLTDKDVSLYSARYDFTPFYTRKVDLWPCYINSQGPILSRKLSAAGEKAAFFNPADFGVQFVANSVVTSERILADHPETVKKFITALLKGWHQALDPANEKKVLDTLGRVDKDTPPDILAQQLGLTRKLIQPGSEFKVGTIDINAWKKTEQIMLAQEMITAPVNIVDKLEPQQ